MRRRRLINALVVLILLAGVAAVLWTALDWPPPRLILKYGLPPEGGPTGRTKTIENLEFIEISSGYRWVHHDVWEKRGDALGRFFDRLGLEVGDSPVRGPGAIRRWVEVGYRFWITPEAVPPERLVGFARLVRETMGEGGDPWELTDALGRSWCEEASTNVEGILRPATAWELHFAEASNALLGTGLRIQADRPGLLRRHPSQNVVILDADDREYSSWDIKGKHTIQETSAQMGARYIVWVPLD